MFDDLEHHDDIERIVSKWEVLRAAAHEGNVRVPPFRMPERRRVHIKAAHSLGLAQETAGRIFARGPRFKKNVSGGEPLRGPIGLAAVRLLHDPPAGNHGWLLLWGAVHLARAS